MIKSLGKRKATTDVGDVSQTSGEAYHVDKKVKASDTSQVFTTYELFEKILLHLDFMDLTLVQCVSKKWHDVTMRSQILKKRLHTYFDERADMGPFTKLQLVHPLIAHGYKPPDRTWVLDRPHLDKLLNLQGGSWENMFICAPALTGVWVGWAKTRSTNCQFVTEANGVRFTTFIAGVREWLAKDHDFKTRLSLRKRQTRSRQRYSVKISLNHNVPSGRNLPWPTSPPPDETEQELAEIEIMERRGHQGPGYFSEDL